jgi:SAM-dependent methyltransferase
VKLVQGLAERDDPHKKYVGLDVHSGLIEFLRANCSPDKFEFATVDFYNKMYNRHGQKMAPGCRLPISDDTFDLLTMFSVITHMEPGDASAILNILGSYAHRDSKLLFSAFVDAQQEEEFVDKDPEKPLRHAYYRKDFLERIIAEAGWKIIEDRPRIRSVIQHHYICARSSQP